MTNTPHDESRPGPDPDQTAPLGQVDPVPADADPGQADPVPADASPHTAEASPRPPLADRLRRRARETSRPVRISAAALLAVLLLLGAGAAGFAIADGAGGRGGDQGNGGSTEQSGGRDGAGRGGDDGDSRDGRGDRRHDDGDRNDDHHHDRAARGLVHLGIFAGRAGRARGDRRRGHAGSKAEPRGLNGTKAQPTLSSAGNAAHRTRDAAESLQGGPSP